MNISRKVFLANVIIVLAATVTTSAISISVTKREITRQVGNSLSARVKAFQQLLDKDSRGMTSVDGSLQANGVALEGRNDLTDNMKSIFGGEATIFRNDVRIATTIKKDDGSRAIGTTMQGPARDMVITRGLPFLGEATILGTPHFAAYLPLKNARGEVIGALFVGEKKSEYLSVFDHLRYMTIMVSLVLAGVLSLLAFLVLKKAFTPLRNLVQTLQDVAEGDGNLTRRLEVSHDEIGTASRYFNKFVESVHSIVVSVADSTNSVACASADMHDNTGKLAETTEAVAAQTEYVATAGEEMAATSADISHNCLAAVASAERACDLASRGASDVEGTINRMKHINEKVRITSESISTLGSRSEEIGDVISTIQDIADQTNLLALNAAIEAARAGDQGRGFAVVADEVRNLAQRTTNATKEIETTIRSIQLETAMAVQVMQESAQEAARGMEESIKSGKSQAEIIEQIRKVTCEIGQIATAAEEQSATSREISNNVHQITGIMQGAAKANRETMSTAEKLHQLSENLKGQICRFSY
ncbi:methyl-accepting chemotaxis protein [Geomonas sp.]|uniref:methyl-accepting chemotaxis protein n=1 Tax=Geomonas sp. TaxID=2651584 RepID=UPI002B46411E|nr:methyl-accepting chemotaxis protein [Geomonas sp.]HJV36107.1 methyl-accepting chemotaxis protein [Geomonas sp.]